MGLGRDLGLAFWALTLFEATIGAYASVWPLWIERLGAPITVVGLVLGLSGVIRPFILMPSSWLFERFNPLHLLMGARLLSVVGLMVAAFAQDWTFLLITVVLNALGEIVFATLHTYVADHGGENKVRAFSMVVTIGPAAALIVMPILSGLVISVFGIRSAFVLASITTLGALYFVAQMNFSRPHHGDDSTTVPTYREAFQHRSTRLILLVHGMTLICLSLGVSLIPNYLEDFRHISPSTISILSAGAAVGTAGFAVYTARSKRLQSSPLIAAAIATCFVIAGMLIMAAFSPLPFVAVAYLFRGGLFSAWVLFISAIGELTPQRLLQRAFIALEILGGGAMSFGPVLSAQLYRFDPRLPLVVGAIGASAMVVVIVRTSRIVSPVATPVAMPEGAAL
jgi:predicted MFS family arabinose efflux permease